MKKDFIGILLNDFKYTVPEVCLEGMIAIPMRFHDNKPKPSGEFELVILEHPVDDNRDNPHLCEELFDIYLYETEGRLHVALHEINDMFTFTLMAADDLINPTRVAVIRGGMYSEQSGEMLPFEKILPHIRTYEKREDGQWYFTDPQTWEWTLPIQYRFEEGNFHPQTIV